MKQILQFGLLLYTLLFCVLQANSQACVVKASANNYDLLCGDTLKLTAIGNGILAFRNNFNCGAVQCPQGDPTNPNDNYGTWANSSTAQFDNPCLPDHPGNGPHIWFNENTPSPRALATTNLPLTTGGVINFDMRFADPDFNTASPCENPDWGDEGVHVQYSNDNGATWTDIVYYDPSANGGNDPNLTVWNSYTVSIPAGAMTGATRIRWVQLANTIGTLGDYLDHWGLDNLEIIVNPPVAQYTWSHTGVTLPTGDSPPFPPINTNTYTVTYTDGTNTCTDNVNVIVRKPTISATLNPSTPVCPGVPVQLTAISSMTPPTLACQPTLKGCVGNTTVIDVGTGVVNSTTYQMFGGPTSGGCGSVNGTYTTDTYDGSATTQMIFRASEFPTLFTNYGGQITQLQLNFISIASTAKDYAGFTIKMGCTSKASYASNAQAEYVGGLSTVFNAKTVILGAGWKSFDLDVPYDWDGTSNLVVQICWGGGSVRSGNVFKTATGFNSVVHSSVCGDELCGYYNSSKAKVDQNRPSAKFGICYRPKPVLVYSWTPDINLSNDSILNPTAIAGGVAAYTVTVRDLNTPAGCAVSQTVNMNLENPGTVDAKYDSLCVDSTLKLYAAIATPDPAVAFTWTGPSGFTANVQNPTRNPGIGIAGWYYVTASKNGCVGTDSVEVKINTPPNPGKGYIDSLCCLNATPYNLFTKLTGNPQTGGTWSSFGSPAAGSALTGSNFTAAMASTIPGDYKFKYILTTTNGCGSRDTVVTIKVKKDPFSGLDSTFSICNSGTTLNLVSYLKKSSTGRAADAGGTWTDISSTSAGAAFNSPAGVLNISNLAANTYKFKYTVAPNDPCAGQFATITVKVEEQPEAGNPAVSNLCINGSALSLFSIISGTYDGGGSWRKDGTFNGTLNSVTGDYAPTGTISDTGSFKFTYKLSATSPCKADSVQLTINVNGYPSFSNSTTQCDPSNTTYTASIDIQGGQRSSYSVTPAGGSLSGNNPTQYTSSSIPNGQSVTFKVVDAFACKIDSVTVMKNCACATDAGTMNLQPLSICCGSTTPDTYNGGFVDDGNDLLRYYLHEGSGSTLVNVRGVSTTPTFGCGAGIVNGQTYYISAVAGNDNGSGNIDVTDVCLSVSPGTPVVFHDLPQATLSGPSYVCMGSNAQLQLNFTAGSSPFEVAIFDGGATTTTSGLNSPQDSISVSPTTTTSYELRNLKDKFGCLTNFTSNTPVTVTVKQPPTASISTSKACSDNNSPGLFDITVTSTAPSPSFTVTYSNSVNGAKYTNGNFSGSSISIPDTIAHPNSIITYTLDTVYDNSGNQCVGVISGTAVIYPIPTATISAKSDTICLSSPVELDIALTGIGPWEVIYNDGIGGANQTINIASTPYSLTLANPGSDSYSYTIFSVEDQVSGGSKCYSSGTGIAKVTVNNPVQVTMLIEDPGTLNRVVNDSYCQGFGPRNLLFSISPTSGTGNNFSVEYRINNEPTTYSQLISRPDSTVSVNPPAGTYNYNVENVFDLTKANCQGSGSGASIQVNPTPIVKLTRLDSIICQGNSSRIKVEVFAGNGTVSFTLKGTGSDTQQYPYSGTTLSSPDTLLVTPGTSGTATYSILGLSSNTTPTCTGNPPNPITVTVNPKPTATFTTTYYEICKGTPFSLAYKLTGNNTINTSYGYAGGASSAINKVAGSYSTPPISTLDTGLYTYSFGAISDGSIAACAGTALDSAQVRVRPYPTLTASLITPVCFGSADSITFSNVKGNGPFTIFYADNFGLNTSINTNGNTSVIIPTDKDREYNILRIEDNSSTTVGAAGKCISMPNSLLPLKVHQLPIGSIGGIPREICAGLNDSVQVTLNGTPPLRVEFIDQNGVINYQYLGLPNGTSLLPINQFIATLTDSLRFFNLSIKDGNSPQCTSVLNTLDTAFIHVNPVPAPDFTRSRPSGCAPLAVTFTNIPETNYVTQSVLWTFSDGSFDTNPNSTQKTFVEQTTHSVTLTISSAQGCTGSTPKTIVVNQDPIADFSWEPQPVTMSDALVKFVNNSIGGSTFQWRIDNLDTITGFEPRYQFPADDEGFYEVCLIAISNQLCRDTLCLPLKVNGEVLINIPNSFSPNGDGYNETWYPVTLGYRPEFFSLTVYDRWGQPIFHTNDPDFKWNGKNAQNLECPEGVYAYRLEVRSKYSGARIAKTGNVNIVR